MGSRRVDSDVLFPSFQVQDLAVCLFALRSHSERHSHREILHRLDQPDGNNNKCSLIDFLIPIMAHFYNPYSMIVHNLDRSRTAMG